MVCQDTMGPLFGDNALGYSILRCYPNLGVLHPSSECDDKPIVGPKEEEANYAYKGYRGGGYQGNYYGRTFENWHDRGKTYDPPVNPNDKTTIIDDDIEDEADEAEKKEGETSSSKQTKSDPPLLKVKINVPLVDVLAGMPNYHKVLKRSHEKKKVASICKKHGFLALGCDDDRAHMLMMMIEVWVKMVLMVDEYGLCIVPLVNMPMIVEDVDGTCPWVSPARCVPKKGEMTVVTNEKNELVPTRTVTVIEEIVLGHKVSSAGLEVDKAKINVIAKLPPPTNVEAVRSFLGHAGFYRRFIKDFSKISRPMTKLLEKDSVFDFNKECIEAFEALKEKLTNAPIMVSLDWSEPFQLMCDASDMSLELCLRIMGSGNILCPFTRQQNTKQLITRLYGLLKNSCCRSKIYIALIRWILLLQEFASMNQKQEKEQKNCVTANNLLRVENPNLEELRDEDINDNFPNETLMNVSSNDEDKIPWFADFANYPVGKILRKRLTYPKKPELPSFFTELKHNFWDEQ
ncbi:reverse transcriptase domain-containing protein [Tanacetum coccineum]|uniref:Reverse transcriptase domain-containing protein n=1 Tax=Tanacetum coccineum TaxID=301880 RepID=A0ABQ4Y9P8_9ASTR